jgi:ferredoxin--NADP+ reductase
MTSATRNRQRIAIVGAGPAGFYTAAALLKEDGVDFNIDLIDKLPAPFGLLRYGVAPDHQKIKKVRVVFERTLHDERTRFFGGVKLGRDITRDDLLKHYDRVIYATGSQGDRKLGIAGEDLPGVLSATEFVAWYNGHPEYAHLDPNLQVSQAVIVGAGNVALDVARVLAKSAEELARTDIANHALSVLAESQIEDIYILARRGPAEAKFTNPELREFGRLENALPTVRLYDFEMDEVTEKELQEDRIRRRNVEMLREFHDLSGRKQRKIHFRFLESPTRIVGDSEGGVSHIEVVRNRLERDESGRQRPVPTDDRVLLPAGLVVRSIGYLGTPIPGVPFDRDRGVMPTAEGRLLSEPGGEHAAREYVVGWAKRGATGVIGTNKPDAEETAQSLIEDALSEPSEDFAPGIESLLEEKGIRWISSERWQQIDEEERKRGEAEKRPRIKFIGPDEYHSV